MIIQKAGVIKFLRYLGIFCAITMGFFSIVGSDEDDAADLLGLPDSAETEFELDSVDVTKIANGEAIQPQFAITEGCGTTTIQEQLDMSDLDSELLDLIDSIDFEALAAEYQVTAYTGTKEPLTCTLTIAYNEEKVEIGSIVVQDLDVDTLTEVKSVELLEGALEAINYYLDKANWDEPLDYCVSCSEDNGTLIDSYSLTYTPTLKVKAKR